MVGEIKKKLVKEKIEPTSSGVKGQLKKKLKKDFREKVRVTGIEELVDEIRRRKKSDG